MTRLDAVKEALLDCVKNAPEDCQNALAQSLEDFAHEAPRSFAHFERGIGRALPLEDIEEVVEARIERVY